MAEDYSRELLRRAVAQVCQLLGWHAMHSSPLAVLTHVLEKYLVALAESAHRYAEHDCRTEPTLDDLACAFRDLNVRLPELKAYAKAVPPAPLPHPVPPYPVERAPSLNFLKPGSREVVTRPPHVHDHLPPMWPERENEGDVDVESPAVAPLAPPPDPFKRPGEPASNSIKRPKLKHEDECHARELSSVMMTVSGFLSPAREGKLPEARTPIIVPDVPPEKPKPLQFNPFTGRPPPPVNDRPDKKIKKSKAVNGKIDKNKKKEKPSKNADKPYVPNENRSNKHGGHAPKARPPPKNHPDESHPSARPLFFPDNNIKTIKQEVIDRPVKVFPPPVEHRPPRPVPQVPFPLPPTILNPHKINASKPASILNDQPKAPPVPFPVTIKEEKMDSEKLTSQPDRSKMNIFKKISTKIKEEKLEKPYDPPVDRTMPENVTIKIEKTSPPRSSPQAMDDYSPKLKPLNLEMRTSTSYTPSVVDLSSKRNNSDVINVDEMFDIKQKIKQEPIDDYPTDLTRPKISVMPHNVLVGNSIIKEKKDKKRKERKIKTEKLPKEHTKVKKQHPIDKMKPINELGEPSGAVNFPDNILPFLSTQPGLIPNRNLFELMNTGLSRNLFTQMPNPALRGLLPHDTANMLPNPFSMKEGSNNLMPPTPGFAPGLIPHGFNNPMLNHGFGQPPRMPQPPNLPSFLRRPSLEVIPIDGDEDTKVKPKSQFVSPALVIKEKDKQKNIKHPVNVNVNNSFISNSVSITNSTQKHSPPKSSPVINVPNIKPDVTIQLNSPPTEKIKTVDLSKLVDNSSFTVKEKDKSEKKKDKLHKKDKKDKEQRLKKKKDKKEKLRLKKERDREENKEVKEKPKKDKKEKKRDKEKPPNVVEGLIPKLTLKLGPPSPMPPSPDTIKRLNIKPIVKKEEEVHSPLHISPVVEPKPHVENNQSPELAKISALVTRPPKSKSSSKHNTSKSDSNESNIPNSPPAHPSNVSPIRKTKPPYAKYKRLFKPVARRNSSDFDDPIISLTTDELEITEAAPPERIANVPLGIPNYTDQGSKVWICPACRRPDNGTPMIACDGCDEWYHWVCVGIRVEPENSEDWYCTNCSAKRTAMASAMAGGQTGKKRGRKPKVDKLKENR